MPDSKKTYESLLQQGFSKQEVDSVLHKLTLQRLKEKTSEKPIIRNRSTSTISLCQQKLHLLKQLTAKGLCLLKTQFAKKPKNPI